MPNDLRDPVPGVVAPSPHHLDEPTDPGALIPFDCAREVHALRVEVDEIREQLRETTSLVRESVALGREHLEETRAARKARHVCLQGVLNAVTRAVELVFGDQWIRRAIALAILVGALALAGYGFSYGDRGLVIGHGLGLTAEEAEEAAEENAHDRALDAIRSGGGSNPAPHLDP